MPSKYLSGILVTALIFGLSMPAGAQNSSANIAPSGKRPAIVSGPIGPTPSTGAVVGVIAGVVAGSRSRYYLDRSLLEKTVHNGMRQLGE